MAGVDDRSVVITGASSGIGQAAAARLCRAGWTVFGTVRTQAAAARAKAAGVHPLQLDVRDTDAVAAAAEAVREALGGRPLTALVNNAGRGHCRPALRTPIDELEDVLQVNLVGAMRCVQAFAPLMDRGSRIVNVTSTGGRTGFPFMSAYVASKHGLEGLSATLRRELALVGIHVIVLAPGPVATGIWERVTVDPSDRDGPFAAPLRRFEAELQQAGRTGLDPEIVARTLEKALTARRPRSRYRVAPRPLKALLGEWLPDAITDRFIRRQLDP